jgi:hypothetical protein
VKFIVLDTTGPEFKLHVCEFAPCDHPQLQLTSPQLRKLAFYRGQIEKCRCGVISLAEMGGTRYSRNGNRV